MKGEKIQPRLRPNNKRMQHFGDLRKAVRYLKKALHQKPSLGPKIRNVVLGDEASHAPRGGSISTLVTLVTSVAKNKMSRNMKIALQL